MNDMILIADKGVGQAKPSPFVTGKDGTRLYVQDWGRGRPILFVAAWALSSDFWGAAALAMQRRGFRSVAFDRRGHGRSDAPSYGYDADTLARDLASLIETRDLHDVVLVTHSMGAGEAVRYLSRYGAARIAKLVLVAPTTPYLVRTNDNPEGVPLEALNAPLAEIARDYPKWVGDNEAPFFTPETEPETRAWIKAMMLDVPAPIAVAFREESGRTDYRGDLAKIDIPTMILHGDRDASAPLPITGERTARAIGGAKLVVYEGAPHALPLTHRDRFIDDLAGFAAQ
jgi:pimeloyl-ACP methyl ester carboxylesterase